MNNNFNFGRFGKYFVYDLKRQWKNIGMLVLTFALSPVIFYMLYMFFAALFDGGLMKLFSGMSIDGPSIWVRFGMAAVMITIFVMLFPSRAYGEITDKAKGSEWLMLPASRLEKYVSMMLVTLLVIPIMYIVVYLLSDGLVCLFDKSCGGTLMSFRINDLLRTTDIIIPANGLWIIIANTVQNAIIFLLGGLIFKKWKVVGTLLANFAIGMFFSTLISMLFANMDPVMVGEKFMNWTVRHADSVDLWLNGFINVWTLLIVAVCAIWIWFRLKRIQH